MKHQKHFIGAYQAYVSPNKHLQPIKTWNQSFFHHLTTEHVHFYCYCNRGSASAFSLFAFILHCISNLSLNTFSPLDYLIIMLFLDHKQQFTIIYHKTTNKYTCSLQCQNAFQHKTTYFVNFFFVCTVSLCHIIVNSHCEILSNSILFPCSNVFAFVIQR